MAHTSRTPNGMFIEIKEGRFGHDVYISYNGSQWSGLTTKNIPDLEQLYTVIGFYLEDQRERGVSI